MKEQIVYNTKGVCSRKIDITVNDGIVESVQFTGGCSGNTQGVSILAVGMTVEEVIKRLSGIKCGMKETSCPDQLATALKEHLAKKV
jgi:uncharacterized protein (TIGR03905 family)